LLEAEPEGRSASPRTPSRFFLLALVGATALGPVSVQMFLPALPAIQAAFGVSSGVAQLTLSASMAAIAFATLAYGPLSDRYGRRPVLIAGQALFLLGSAACAWAPGISTLVAGRVVQAAGACSGMVLARAIVRDAYPLERVTAVLAYFTLAMAAFPMFTPAIGGALIDFVHWRAVFVFSLGVGGLALAAVVFGVWETRPGRAAGAAGAGPAGARALLRTRAFWAYTAIGAFGSAAFFGFISGVPYLMIQVMGRPAREYGYYFVSLAAAFMLGSLVAARASARVRRDRMLALAVLAMLSSGAGLLALHALGVWHPLALFAPGVVLTFAQGIAGPNAQAGVVSGDPAHAGAASGVLGFVQTLSAAAFAQAVGSLQDGTPLPLSLCVLVSGLGGLLSLRLLPRRASGERASGPVR
jgi:DHA1 family bicyclomycin/chloramphenicol resistance-like MFS transporter